MKQLMIWTLCSLAALAACRGGPRARSETSYDDIARQVTSMNASQILEFLGEPDSRQPAFGNGESWIWWNYTFLAGEDYPPEVRGRVVHLEITLRNSAVAGTDPPPYSQWWVAKPFGVAYRNPSTSAQANHEFFGNG